MCHRHLWTGRLARLLVLPGALLATLLCDGPAAAEIVRTTDPAVAAAFLAGADVERFDDLPSFPLDSYGPGQTLDPAARFHSRDPLAAPTFNSGGGTFSDPVGNPGTPIGIFAPQGDIAGDVVSPAQVAGPLVVTDPTQPFANGFMEAFFVDEVARVGFWVTHGSVMLNLFDGAGAGFADGDATVIGQAGEFIGIDRGAAEIKLVSLLPTGGSDAFTIDDFAWSGTSRITPHSERLAFSGVVQGGVYEIPELIDVSGVATSADGAHLYAISGGNDTLAVLERDPDTGRLSLVQSLEEGVGGVAGLQGPLNVAVSPDDRSVYVVDGGRLAVFARDTETGTLTFLEVFQDGVAGVGGLGVPFGLVVSPDGEHVYAAGHTSQAIAVFDRDPSDGRLAFVAAVSAGIAEVGGLTNKICMSPDGATLYAASFFDMLGVYARDPASGALVLVEVEDLDATTSDCAVSPDGAFVYTGGPAQSVEVLARDAATGAVDRLGASDPIGTFPGHLDVSLDGGALYAHGGSAVAVLERDAGTGALAPIQLFEDGEGGVDGLWLDGNGPLAQSPDGRHLYVAGSGDSAIAVFARPRYQHAGSVSEGDEGVEEVLGKPSALAISADGRRAYVTGQLSGTVAVFGIPAGSPSLELQGVKRQGAVESANGLPIQGLIGATDLALSPDGAQLYVAAATDAVSTLTWLDVAPDGGLTYRFTYVDPSLEGASGVRVSDDGLHLYVSTQAASGWVVFDRFADGSLLLLEAQAGGFDPTGLAISPDDDVVFFADNEGSGGASAYRREIDGTLAYEDSDEACEGGDASEIAVSGDGRYVYLSCEAGVGSGIAVLGWDDAAGGLDPIAFIENEPQGVIDGLEGALGIAVSTDDTLVAVAARDSDGFTLFARDADTGRLHLAQEELEAVSPTPLGLTALRDVGLSPDGRYLLAAGGGADDGTVVLYVPEPGSLSGLAAGGIVLALLARRRSPSGPSGRCPTA